MFQMVLVGAYWHASEVCSSSSRSLWKKGTNKIYVCFFLNGNKKLKSLNPITWKNK